jgi:FRG domain-containing protein
VPRRAPRKRLPARRRNTPSTFRIIEIDTWSDYQKVVTGSELRGWAFRGQRDAGWRLESSISRLLRQYSIDRRAWVAQERRVHRIFQRKAHLFLSHVPPADDDFQWLALMQHHGSPTRLLDFTWSPFVAAFFALESATGPAAVWAVSVPLLWRERFRLLDDRRQVTVADLSLKTPGNYERWFLEGSMPFLFPGEPLVMNQRLVAQSGTFVVPSVLDRAVEDIINTYTRPSHTLVKLTLNTVKMRDEAMYALYSMNVSHATLFPGLDGMARSLAYELEYDWYRNPKTYLLYPGFEFPPASRRKRR